MSGNTDDRDTVRPVPRDRTSRFDVSVARNHEPVPRLRGNWMAAGSMRRLRRDRFHHALKPSRSVIRVARKRGQHDRPNAMPSLCNRRRSSGHRLRRSRHPTAPKLAETLVQFANGPVIVDLADATFLDASGMRALSAAQRHIERRKGRLIVEGTSAAVRRVFDVGLDMSLLADSNGAELQGIEPT
jgi:anti-anti-sigma factor